jgi:SAM-dependent methyltransferase
MTIHESNQTQADFWTAAGTLWTALRERFDSQVNEHGLAAIDALAPQTDEAVIDIGCGAGTSTVQLATRVGPGGNVRGLDISPTMIEGAAAHAAAQGHDNVTFTVGDAMVEPFHAEADAVFSRFGMMFFADATAAFTNILGALRPGGRLGFVCWQSPMENPWVSTPLAIAADFVEIPFGGDPTAPGPFSLGDPERLRSVVSDAGFVDLVVEPRAAPVYMGTDAADAVDFVSKMMPPVVALQADDPDKFAELRARVTQEISAWDGPDGVRAPSATWIVTARRAE